MDNLSACAGILQPAGLMQWFREKAERFGRAGEGAGQPSGHPPLELPVPARSTEVY